MPCIWSLACDAAANLHSQICALSCGQAFVPCARCPEANALQTFYGIALHGIASLMCCAQAHQVFTDVCHCSAGGECEPSMQSGISDCAPLGVSGDGTSGEGVSGEGTSGEGVSGEGVSGQLVLSGCREWLW